jgi:hypothetical protein
LRHSFASIANDLGFTEVTIAALVGHAKGSVTSKYTGESGEFNLAAMRLARYSSSHRAVLRRRRMESLPGAFRVRL